MAAYECVVNGRPAIEWIRARYQKSTDKDSGITVSLETMKVVRGFPGLNEKKIA